MDGLIADVPVAIWDSNGNTLAFVTVTNGTSTIVPHASTLGQWRLEGIAPVSVPTGTYVIGGYAGRNIEPVITGAAPVSNEPSITYIGDCLDTGGSPTLAFPTTTFGNPNRYFGPTFGLTELQAVPEPSLSLLLGMDDRNLLF